MKPKIAQIVEFCIRPLTILFILLSTAFLASFLWGDFAAKLKVISAIGLLIDTWSIVLILLLAELILYFLLFRHSSLKIVFRYSVAVLIVYPLILFCAAFFLSRTSSYALRDIRNNAIESSPLHTLYAQMDRKSVDNPVTFSRYIVFVEGVSKGKVVAVLKMIDLFVGDLEKYYDIRSRKSIYIVAADKPMFDTEYVLASLYGRNVIVIAKENLFLESGVSALKHEITHIFNKIHAGNHKIAFPKFIDELMAQRLRLLRGNKISCNVPTNYKKYDALHKPNKLIQLEYEKLRQYYTKNDLLAFPEDIATTSLRYDFLDLVSCNLNVPLERYLEWVKQANTMSVGEAFIKTFGVNFESFVENPEKIKRLAGNTWMENQLKVLENEN